MGMPCKFYNCSERARRFARLPLALLRFHAGPIPEKARMHPYCTHHADKIEKRLDRYAYP